MISFITPSTRCKNPKITEITLVFAVTTTTARLHCLFPQRRYKTSVSPQLGHLTGTDDRWLIRELVFSLFLPNWVHCQLLRALTPHFKSCTIPDCHLVGVGTLKNTKICHPESWKSRAFHPNKTQTDWVTERWEISLASATYRHLVAPSTLPVMEVQTKNYKCHRQTTLSKGNHWHLKLYTKRDDTLSLARYRSQKHGFSGTGRVERVI